MRRLLIMVFLLAGCIGLTVWITEMGRVGVMPTFTYEAIWVEFLTHLKLVFVALGIAIIIGVPLGILLTGGRFKRLAIPIIGVASAGQAVPGMALMMLMFPLLGLGFQPALVALIIGGLLPILRNSNAAIKDINPAIIQAARGMGMTKGQMVRKIELPLALPVIMAGIRVATVVLVGTATLAAIIGAGSLGAIILAGVGIGEPLIVLQGAAPVAAMAIILGFILECIERWMTPRGLRVKAGIS